MAISDTWVIKFYYNYFQLLLNLIFVRTHTHTIFAVGFFFDEQEIIPFVRGDFRFDAQNNPIKKFPSPENEIRAIVEGQLVAKRAHAESLGFTIGKKWMENNSNFRVKIALGNILSRFSLIAP